MEVTESKMVPSHLGFCLLILHPHFNALPKFAPEVETILLESGGTRQPAL